MKEKKQSRRTKKKGTIWMTGGLLLLAAALFLTAYNLYDGKRAGLATDKVAASLVSEMEENQRQEDSEGQVPDYVLYPDKEMPTIEIDGNRYIGLLEIPDLNLLLPVMAGEWSTSKLRIAPCRYSGSIYQDNLVIAAHNYARHFGKIQKLPVGTVLRFVDVEGNVFQYEIVCLETLGQYDVEEMLSEDDEWDLTLFTCNYSGNARVTLRCKKDCN